MLIASTSAKTENRKILPYLNKIKSNLANLSSSAYKSHKASSFTALDSAVLNNRDHVKSFVSSDKIKMPTDDEKKEEKKSTLLIKSKQLASVYTIIM